MTPQEVLSAAKAGNPQAIAALMNRHLQPKSITAQVNLLNDCLYIVLESAQAPNQQALVAFVSKGIQNLQVASIKRLIVYGKRSGEEEAVWTAKVKLGEDEPVEDIRSANSTVTAQPAFASTLKTAWDRANTIWDKSQAKVAAKQSNTSEVKTTSQPLLWVGSIGGLLILIGILNVVSPAKQSQSPAAPTTQPSAVGVSPDTDVSSTVATESPKGIGISREAVQSIYEKPEIGFSFEPSSTINGQPRVLGKAQNGLGLVELIGPPSNITKATIIVGFPSDNAEARNLNLLLLLGFVKNTAPDWQEGPDWVANGIKSFSKSQTEVRTVRGNRSFQLTYTESLASMTLVVSPE